MDPGPLPSLAGAEEPATVEVVGPVVSITKADGYPDEIGKADANIEISFEVPTKRTSAERYRILRVDNQDGKLVWKEPAPTISRAYGNAAAINVYETGVYALARIRANR